MLPNRKDPTGTRDLRAKGLKTLEGKFSRYKKTLRKGVSSLFSGLSLNVELEEIERETNLERKVELTLLYLEENSKDILEEETQESNKWWLLLLLLSYSRGQAVAENKTKGSLVNTGFRHMEKERLLAERSRKLLEKNLEEMKMAIAALIREQKTKPRKAKDVLADIERVREKGKASLSRTLRTEIVFANQLAMITQGEAIEEATRVTVKYRWITMRDDRVRDSHVKRDNNLYTKAEVLPLLGEPNCRCAIEPVPVSKEGKPRGAFNPIFSVFS